MNKMTMLKIGIVVVFLAIFGFVLNEMGAFDKGLSDPPKFEYKFDTVEHK